MAQMKEQIKALNKELSSEEIGNLLGAQCKTLVSRMLTEIKENVQGTNSDRKETGAQINGLRQKEGRNISTRTE